MEKVDVKIKYHVSGMEEISPAHPGEWVDLRCGEEVFIPEGQYALVSLGVSMELPEGYEAIVAPRSSTFKRHGLIMVNAPAVIDNAYCGDNDIWRFPCYCLKGHDVAEVNHRGMTGTFLHVNDRICQFRIQKQQPSIQFLRVTKLGNPERGGIGSTGR